MPHRLRYLARQKIVDGIVYPNEVVTILQEAIEVDSFGGVKTYEWRDVPTILHSELTRD